MNWLILRDVLNTTCNIMSAAYKRVGGWEGGGESGDLTIPVDTVDQVVCRTVLKCGYYNKQ